MAGLGIGRYFLTGITVLAFALFLTFPSAQAAHRGNDASLADQDHLERLWEALETNIIRPLKLMTEQLVTVMGHQTLIIGTLMDARIELETQRLIQDMAADAHADYHPDIQMCIIGTNVRSLARADINSREQARLFTEVVLRRELMKDASSAAGGDVQDYNVRAGQFKSTYCNLRENAGWIGDFCNNTSGPLTKVSKDIDFTRTIDGPYTLDVNFADNAIDGTDEGDIIALSKYLFSHQVFEPMRQNYLELEGGDDLFLNTRTVHAARSVAQDSFSRLVGMRAGGSGDAVAPYMERVMDGLGIPDQAIEDFLGDNPSYYAQMEVLARKLYQSPEFYTNLYTSPVNVKRAGVALKAISLMQDRDRYESALRREMLVSVILEMNLRGHQSRVNSRLLSLLPSATFGN